MEMNRILLADNMDVMREIPDKYFELAIVDPPYIDSFTTDGCISNKGKKGNYKTDGLNNAQPKNDYFNELKRITKNQIIWGSNYYAYPLVGGLIIWDKDNTGNYSDCEVAYQSFSNTIRKFTYRWNGMLQADMKNKEHRIHPTQKPVALYKWLLKNYAKPGDKILDTHLGSGSSVIACLEMGFEYLAIEKDPDYHAAACKRVAQYQSQFKLTF